jgi:hypothetical protein
MAKRKYIRAGDRNGALQNLFAVPLTRLGPLGRSGQRRPHSYVSGGPAARKEPRSVGI